MGKNNGKQLEKVIRLIQETLKDKQDTRIYSNHKLENSSGTKREFDILIETTVNDIIIRIVIECKDFSKPVSVEKIEAFKAKCDRIPSINKKIFVSKNGYQSDAIKAAKDFGIELYELKDITNENILEWMNISIIGMRFFVKTIKNIYLDVSEEIIDKIKNENKEFEFYVAGEKKDLNNFISSMILQEKDKFWSINIFEFMRNGGDIKKNNIIPCEITIKDGYLKLGDTKYIILGLDCEIETFFIENEPKYVTTQIFNLGNETKAKRLAIDLGFQKEQTDIIITKNKFKIFHTDEKNNVKEMKQIVSFNSKTGKFK
ncbi:MAG: restriction endonuclease [Raineya sp.]|jgi:hypothetical protein|nr:restriction endonuclease [Raineya sp.]